MLSEVIVAEASPRDLRLKVNEVVGRGEQLELNNTKTPSLQGSLVKGEQFSRALCLKAKELKASAENPLLVYLVHRGNVDVTEDNLFGHVAVNVDHAGFGEVGQQVDFQDLVDQAILKDNEGQKKFGLEDGSIKLKIINRDLAQTVLHADANSLEASKDAISLYSGHDKSFEVLAAKTWNPDKANFEEVSTPNLYEQKVDLDAVREVTEFVDKCAMLIPASEETIENIAIAKASAAGAGDAPNDPDIVMPTWGKLLNFTNGEAAKGILRVARHVLRALEDKKVTGLTGQVWAKDSSKEKAIDLLQEVTGIELDDEKIAQGKKSILDNELITFDSLTRALNQRERSLATAITKFLVKLLAVPIKSLGLNSVSLVEIGESRLASLFERDEVKDAFFDMLETDAGTTKVIEPEDYEFGGARDIARIHQKTLRV